MSLLQQLSAGGASPPNPAIEDYFSAYTYAGNGANQTITNGLHFGDEQASVYITPGTYSWTAPAGVTSVSVVCIGGSTDSYFINTSTVVGGGPTGIYSPGTYVGDGGGNGGAAGTSGANASGYWAAGGAGGAGGYTGAGGAGGPGAGDGVSTLHTLSGGGGGTGIYGIGTSGSKGTNGSRPASNGFDGTGGGGGGSAGSYVSTSGTAGSGGSGGQTGPTPGTALGANFGGGAPGLLAGAAKNGAGLGYKNNITVVPGNSYTVVVGDIGVDSNTGPHGSGAVRIVWPGISRQFPATDVAPISTGETKAGLVWIKSRSTASHMLTNTIAGPTFSLSSDTTGSVSTDSTGLITFNSNGFSLNTNTQYNNNATSYVSWSFAQGKKFFKMAQVTVSGSNQTVDLSSLGTVGMVTVKRTDSTSGWYTWHRGLTAGNLVYLNTTAAQAASAAISVSGTTLTLTQATIGNGTYIVYAWAHDTASDGMIQCGTYTGTSIARVAVTLGWEPQYVLIKGAGNTFNWYCEDTARGMSVTDGYYLVPNTSDAESNFGGPAIDPTATGFTIQSGGAGLNQSTVAYIYMAIRRPMKVPTLGTQVYSAIANTGTGAATKVTGVGFAPDAVWQQTRNDTFLPARMARLTGTNFLSYSTGPEQSALSSSYDLQSFDMDGISYGFPGNTYLGISTKTQVLWFFKRAPKVFDVVCSDSTVANIPHSLGVVPELIIQKFRAYDAGDTDIDWHVKIDVGGVAQSLKLNLTSAVSTQTSGLDTASLFYTRWFSANTTDTSIWYLFSTLAGVSKVGSYTGNGSSLTINAGFTTGARFILIKRTDSTGDWFTWDSARGIVAGNDPHLSLNTIAAEVTTDDSVDPDNSGFIVNQLAATNINVTSATYIYLAFA